MKYSTFPRNSVNIDLGLTALQDLSTMELLETFSSPLSVQHTYEDDVRDELCLQLAESLSDLGACEFSREVVLDDGTWLVKATRSR